MENEEKMILVHYINVAGYSKNIREKRIANYINSVSKNSEKLDAIEYFIPIKDGENGSSRIEWISKGKADLLEDKIIRDPKDQYTKSSVFLDYFFAKRKYDEFIECNGLISSSTLDECEHMKKLPFIDVNIGAYNDILLDKDETFVLEPFGIFEGPLHVLFYFIDTVYNEDKSGTSVKMFCKSFILEDYYKYKIRCIELDRERLDES